MKKEIPYGYCQCGCGKKAPIATHTNNLREIKKGRPEKFIHGHNNRLNNSPEELWENVEIKSKDECWNYKGPKLSGGYGLFILNGKRIVASRLAYELSFGRIPDGMQVCHRCDNPPCCNPHHLFIGTSKDNAIDKIKKGRGVDNKGDRHGMAKLSTSSITDIIEMKKNGITQTEISKSLSVNQSTISRIVNGLRWRHLKK